MAKAKPAPPQPQLTIEQVEKMIEETLASMNAPERAETVAFRQKHYSKRARLERVEHELEFLRRTVDLLMLESLIKVRDDLRKGHATNEAAKILSRLTTFKKGEG